MWVCFNFFHVLHWLLTTVCVILPLQQAKSKLADLEYILNLKKFDKPKTLVNISVRILRALNVPNWSMLNHFADDGVSNAIGSVSEYESLLWTACPNEVQFDVCYAHQNQCSGGYASGNLKFSEPLNPSLREIPIKNHQIWVHICHSKTNRMKVYQAYRKAIHASPCSTLTQVIKHAAIISMKKQREQ